MKQLIVATFVSLLVMFGSCTAHAAPAKKQTTAQKQKKSVVKTSIRRGAAAKAVVTRPSFGQLAGLHTTADMLDLKSSVAYVIDQDTNEVLLSKNDHAVLPIASITKLMTGMIVSEAQLPLD